MAPEVKERAGGAFPDVLNDQSTATIVSVFAVVVVAVVLLLLLLLRGRKSKKRTFLLTGVSEAGKTALFSKLVYGKELESYTSIKENSGFYSVASKKLDIPIVDIPGNDRQRLQFWEKFKNEVRGIVFMVDSSKFQKDVKEVAELLFVLLTDPAIHGLKLALLVACNKQDITMSKSAKVIQTQLEKELNTLRVTRAASLDSTDSSGQMDRYFLGKEGKNFEFSQLSPIKVDFVECVCKSTGDRKADIRVVEEWIQKVA